MKDFYDIFVLVNYKVFDIDILYDVFVNIFELRRISIRKNYIEFILKNIKIFSFIEKMYNDYMKRNFFVKDINFLMIIEVFYKVKNLIKYQDEFVIKFKLFMFIRYGEDEQDKIGGWFNNSLIKNGIEQVINLKNKLKDKIVKMENIVILLSDLN